MTDRRVNYTNYRTGKPCYSGIYPGRKSSLYESGTLRLKRCCDGGGFFILSAFLEELPVEENLSRHSRMMSDLLEAGFRFHEVDGQWISTEGTDSVSGGNQEDELSLFVPYDQSITRQTFRDIVLDLMAVYNGGAVIFQEPGGKEVKILDSIGNAVFTLDDFEPDTFLVEWYRARGRSPGAGSYILKGIRRPVNHISAILMRKLGYIL